MSFDWFTGHGTSELIYHGPNMVEFKYWNSWGVFNKIIIPLDFVRYELVIANSALRTSLAICHLIPNAGSWNNCKIANCRKYTSPLPLPGPGLNQAESFCTLRLCHYHVIATVYHIRVSPLKVPTFKAHFVFITLDSFIT